MENIYKDLLSRAKSAYKYAYAPYSNYRVGAAIVMENTSEDKTAIFTGCNVENASYGACNCAERTAIFKGVSEGFNKIRYIAVVSAGGKLTPPCGICRQVISEFADNETIIILEDEGVISTYKVSEILPLSFTKDSME